MTVNFKNFLRVVALGSAVLLAAVVPVIYFSNTVHILVLGAWPHDPTRSFYNSPIFSVTWMESPARMEANYLPAYDVIIINNIPSTLFSDRFVSTLLTQVGIGKGLILFGGQFSLGAGMYYNSAISQLLPVICTSNDFRDAKASLNKTQNQGILSDVDVNSISIEGYNTVTNRINSSVLAIDFYTKHQMIVVGEYRMGKIAVFAFGSITRGTAAFTQIFLNLLKWLVPNSFSKAEAGFVSIQIVLIATLMTFTLYIVRKGFLK